MNGAMEFMSIQTFKSESCADSRNSAHPREGQNWGNSVTALETQAGQLLAWLQEVNTRRPSLATGQIPLERMGEERKQLRRAP